MTDRNAPTYIPANAKGFAGPVAVFTAEWGACRLHDLARISNRRGKQAAHAEQFIAEHRHRSTHALNKIDELAEQLVWHLKGVPTQALKEAIAEAKKAKLVQFKAASVEAEQRAFDEFTRALPSVLSQSKAASTKIDSVDVEPELVTDVVDVAIAVVTVETKDGHKTLAQTVRCTPDCMFVMADGEDVAAADLEGREILRMLADGTEDTFIVPSVRPAVLANAIPVYRLRTFAETFCVAADSTCAAIVRTA